MPCKLYNYNYRRILVLEDNISNITLLKSKSLSSLILMDIVLAFSLLVQAYFLNFSSSFKTCRTIADYISNCLITAATRLRVRCTDHCLRVAAPTTCLQSFN